MAWSARRNASRNMNSSLRPIAIDAHVHLHDVDGAIDAFRMANDRFSRSDGQIGVLMLAERQGFNVLDQLKHGLIATHEPESFWLDGDRKLLILAGRQIVSAEKLEILALATTARTADGLPAERIIAEMDAADAIVVLPWGVGKWIGKRGALVNKLMAAAQTGRLFLGDNGGRPALWRVPRFERMPVLSGSDPLPLPGWPKSIAGLGSIIDAEIAWETPAASLKNALRNPHIRIDRLGGLANPIQFLFDQARLRFAKASIQ